jgi:hypothetical protein
MCALLYFVSFIHHVVLKAPSCCRMHQYFSPFLQLSNIQVYENKRPYKSLSVNVHSIALLIMSSLIKEDGSNG